VADGKAEPYRTMLRQSRASTIYPHGDWMTSDCSNGIQKTKPARFTRAGPGNRRCIFSLGTDGYRWSGGCASALESSAALRDADNYRISTRRQR
jgi:hypothetical protein